MKAPASEALASDVPASGGTAGGVGISHTPPMEPGVAWHTIPVQQSPFVVQAAPASAQELPQVSLPVTGSGKHGSWLQHSPENEQLPPTGTQAVKELQRGIPVASGWQHSLPEMHSQQSLRTLVRSPAQTLVSLKWQTLPSGLHEFLHVLAPFGQLLALGPPQVPMREP